MSRIRTSLRLRMPMIYFAVMIKWRKNNLCGFTEKKDGSLVQIFGLEKKDKSLLSPTSTDLVRYLLLGTLKEH